MNLLIYRLSVRNGLIIGGIYVVMYIIFYLINPILQYTNAWISILIAITMITLIVILAIDIRRQVGGFWNFGKAYLSLMIMSFIVTLMATLIVFIILRFINPGLIQKINDAVEATTESMLEKFGTDQTKIDNATQQFTNGQFMDTLKPTFSNEIWNFIKALLFYWVIDLIIAACVKKNPPMFPMVSDSDIIE